MSYNIICFLYKKSNSHQYTNYYEQNNLIYMEIQQTFVLICDILEATSYGMGNKDECVLVLATNAPPIKLRRQMRKLK